MLSAAVVIGTLRVKKKKGPCKQCKEQKANSADPDVRWLIMSQLICIYAVWKFNCFHFWHIRF